MALLHILSKPTPIHYFGTFILGPLHCCLKCADFYIENYPTHHIWIKGSPKMTLWRDVFPVDIADKNYVSPTVLGLFILPFKDRFPDTKIATYSRFSNRFVFCVLFPVPHCFFLFFPINALFALWHDSPACRLVPRLLPQSKSWGNCIHITNVYILPCLGILA